MHRCIPKLRDDFIGNRFVPQLEHLSPTTHLKHLFEQRKGLLSLSLVEDLDCEPCMDQNILTYANID